MTKQRKTKLIEILCGILGLAFLIFLWWLVSYLMHQNGNRLLPYPSEVFLKLQEVLWTPSEAGDTWTAMGWSLARILIGFSISFVLGAVLGTLGGLYKGFSAFMAPYVTFSKTMPTAAFVLILVGIFYSFRSLPPYIPCFLVFLVAFPMIYEAFRSGIKAESKEVQDALDLDCGKHSFAAVLHVLWPDSQSYISLSLIQTLGLAMKVSIMSEILVNSSVSEGGLGALIQIAQRDLDMTAVVAYSLLAILLILAVDIPVFILKKQLKVGLD
jgi:NitT/TauT family transport system permease protein